MGIGRKCNVRKEDGGDQQVCEKGKRTRYG